MESRKKNNIFDQATAQEIIENLTTKQLQRAYENAKDFYLYGNRQTEVDILVKNVVTLGLSPVFRELKSSFRLPSTVNEINCLKQLHDFMSGPGSSDLFSLKYNVVKELILLRAKNDNAAQQIVTIFSQTLQQYIQNNGQEKFNQRQEIYLSWQINFLSRMSEKELTTKLENAKAEYITHVKLYQSTFLDNFTELSKMMLTAFILPVKRGLTIYSKSQQINEIQKAKKQKLREALYHFLIGEGGTGKNSYKFLVIANLFNFNKLVDDKEAEYKINQTINLLKQKLNVKNEESFEKTQEEEETELVNLKKSFSK